MLKALIKLLSGIGSVEHGVECVLNIEAFDGLLEMIEAIYGNHPAEVVRSAFICREGKWTCPYESIAESFEMCLTGNG